MKDEIKLGSQLKFTSGTVYEVLVISVNGYLLSNTTQLTSHTSPLFVSHRYIESHRPILVKPLSKVEQTAKTLLEKLGFKVTR